MLRLRLSQFVPRGDACHYARVMIDTARVQHMHRHDFHEVFWIIQGQGTHWINGQQRPLYPGSLALICASDTHTFTGKMCLVNVAFNIANWEYLRRRYGLTKLFAPTPLVDREFVLPPLALREIEAIAAELAAGQRNRLATERFLLNLFRFIDHLEQSDKLPAKPAWLITTLRQIADVSHFQNGTRGLTRLAGRSTEHVARELRRWTGKTPTQIVNEARMAYAAQQLIASNDSILTIAMNCGFESLGHFYRLFRATYAMTPRLYRLRQQAIVHGFNHGR